MATGTRHGGMTCTVCRHEAKEAVNQALVAGEPLRDIAGRTGLSKSSLERHKVSHLSATLTKAAESEELAHGERLLDRINGLVDEALGSLDRSKKAGNERAAQGAIREARHSLELTGRLTGELQDQLVTPETALGAIIKMAQALTEAQLRGLAAGKTVEAESWHLGTSEEEQGP